MPQHSSQCRRYQRKDNTPACKSGNKSGTEWTSSWSESYLSVKPSAKSKKVTTVHKQVTPYISDKDGLRAGTPEDLLQLEFKVKPDKNGLEDYLLRVDNIPLNFDYNGKQIRFIKNKKGVRGKFYLDGLLLDKGEMKLTIYAGNQSDKDDVFSQYTVDRGVEYLDISKEKLYELFQNPNPLTVSLFMGKELIYFRQYNIKEVPGLFAYGFPLYTNEAMQYKRKECSSSGGCFMTTAACDAVGLADDCWELTTLRRFRDDYLTHQPKGPQTIAEYYKLAPDLLKKIQATPNARHTLLRIYWLDIVPSALLARTGLNRLANWKYHRMMQRLATTVST